MSVEIHVACRRDPSAVAQILHSCRIAQVEVGPARTVRAWSPRAHATLLLRERDVAGVVTFRSSDNAQSDLVSEYAALVARALEGVAVVDGEVVELSQHHALTAAELASAWHVLEGRNERIVEERQADKRRRRDTWERAQSEGPVSEANSPDSRAFREANVTKPGGREGDDRDYSTH